MLAQIQPILTWLSLNPHWGGFATFVIAFAESLAIIGLLIPGSVIMAAIGALVGANYLPLTNTILCAIGGAILGDILSFWLGYHFHGGIREIWPLRSFPTLLKRGENFFQKHGGKSVFLGRFGGPIRPVVPVIAGMMSMPPLRFLIADVTSAIIWAPVYMLPGILIGTASQALAPKAASELILIVVLALLIVACLFWLIKRIFSAAVSAVHRLLTRAWQSIEESPKLHLLQRILVDPMQPNKPTQLILVIWLLLTIIAFSFLAYNVHSHGILTIFNEPTYHLMRSLRNNVGDYFFVAVTLLSSKVFIPMWLAVFAWLGFRKHWYAAWHWLAVGILITLGTDFFKNLLHSPRPEGLFKTPAEWSFPSGHTTVSVCLFGFLAVLLSRARASVEKRWLFYGTAFFLATLIMISRLYLTAHWLTDVIGGALLALTCILLVTISYRRKVTKPIPITGIIVVAFVSLALSWGWAFYHQYDKLLRDYTPAWQFRTLEADSWWNHTAEQEPVYYRTDRFGKPKEVLNVQWAGLLSTIENDLTQHGWTKLSKPSLIIALNGLTNTNYKHQPLFLDQLYDDRKAVLVMAKTVQLGPNSALLVLHLWDAHLILDNNQPLWLGIISYRKPWHLHFLRHKTINLPQFPSPTDVLIKDLKDFTWKKVPTSPNQVSNSSNDDDDNYVLLIK